jgi:two-component system response regulator GlrR
LTTLTRLARTDIEVLITGPTGVGKELYARFMHEQSQRTSAAFVPLNCGALVDTLFDNELFGHVGGAFTGARQQSQGLIEAAAGGTLFLDEVDSLTLPSQIKLLRFLQEKEYRRLGETRLRKADVRVVAATNADLEAAVHEKRFRLDLFFRLRVAPVSVPALRERPEDLLALTAVFIDNYAETYQLPRLHLSSAAMDSIQAYPWPGNVRELENCIRYLTCLSLDRPVQPSDLPLLNAGDPSGAGPDEAAEPSGPELPVLADRPFNEAKRVIVNHFESEYVKRALSRFSGNVSRAARASGKDRRAFFELMRKHSLNAPDFRRDMARAAPQDALRRNAAAS